jgi:predicted nucleotidyltransferase
MTLQSAQVTALEELRAICEELGAQMGVIGATAYHAWIDDPWLSTNDVDIAVALDLLQYEALVQNLRERGWQLDGRLEHRWVTPLGSVVDILPAGKALITEGQIRWPNTDRVMSLVGFRHVFDRATLKELGPGLVLPVIPPHVYALLKIVAYLDRPPEREKDLESLASLLVRYEDQSDRRFGGEIIKAGIQYSEAGAYLLGHDLGAICNAQETQAVRRFVELAQNEENAASIRLARYAPAILGEDKSEKMRSQISAFSAGFEKSRMRARKPPS